MYSVMTIPFVEIEIRLGTLSKCFDNSIDPKYFQQILHELERGTWVLTEITNTSEYVSNNNGNNNNNNGNNGNTKLITNLETNEKHVILKEKVFKKDFQINNSPFDIRYSVNQEFSLDSVKDNFQKENCSIRNKSRKSFISDNFRYDLTYVKETINNISKEKYEIEIELIVNKDTLLWTPQYVNDFMECKIYDLINIVEPLDRDTFRINII